MKRRGNGNNIAARSFNVRFTVEAAPTPPVVTDPLRPKTITAPAGSRVTLTVTSPNTAAYQWMVDRGDGRGFAAIADANGASYVTPPLTSENVGYRYRCELTNDLGTMSTPIFTLRIGAHVPHYDANPPTGDGSLPGLWALLALLSMGALVCVLRGYKKQKER